MPIKSRIPPTEPQPNITYLLIPYRDTISFQILKNGQVAIELLNITPSSALKIADNLEKAAKIAAAWKEG